MRTWALYCERADLNLDDDRLVQLTDNRANKGVIDWTLVDKARADASDYVDGKLRGKYAIPLNPIPELVRRWAAWIARYYLFDRRESMEMPDTVVRGYKDAKAELDAASTSPSVELGAPRATADTAPSAAGGGLEDIQRRFGRGRDWI